MRAAAILRLNPHHLFSHQPQRLFSQLPFATGADEDPSWTPDGQFITFSSSRDGNRELYLMPAVGGGVAHRLTVDCAREIVPVWSSGTFELLPSGFQPATHITSVKNDQRVNLREGPGTSFDTGGDAGPGECLTVIGRSADSTWLEVRLEQGRELWIAAHLTDISGDLSAVPVTEGRG